MILTFQKSESARFWQKMHLHKHFWSFWPTKPLQNDIYLHQILKIDHRLTTNDKNEIFIINYSLFTISYVPSVFRPFLQPRASSQIHLRTFRILHLPNPHLRSHHGFLQAPKIDQCRVVIGPFSVRFRIVIGPITRDQRHARSQNHINHH